MTFSFPIIFSSHLTIWSQGLKTLKTYYWKFLWDPFWSSYSILYTTFQFLSLWHSNSIDFSIPPGYTLHLILPLFLFQYSHHMLISTLTCSKFYGTSIITPLHLSSSPCALSCFLILYLLSKNSSLTLNLLLLSLNHSSSWLSKNTKLC